MGGGESKKGRQRVGGAAIAWHIEVSAVTCTPGSECRVGLFKQAIDIILYKGGWAEDSHDQ